MDERQFFWNHNSIRNVSLNQSDIKRLYNIVQSRQNIILEKDKEEWTRNNPNTPTTELKQILERADNLYKCAMIIFMKNGDSITTFDSTAIDNHRVNDTIERIIIDPCERFRSENKIDIFPHCRIEISLVDNSLFNPGVIVSNGTQNDSFVKITGSDVDWCSRTWGEVRLALDEKKNYRGIIHGKFFYDVALFLIFIPSLAFILYSFNAKIKIIEQSISLVVIYYIATSILFLSILGFRLFFDYIRWLFPTVEVSPFGIRRGWHRWIVSLMPLSYFAFIVSRILPFW
jgi:hypothetical protein